ncbi:MAG: diaminopimelate epimerase [Flavobacteriaceae bacterium]
MQKIDFFKYQGAGNDFVMIDNRTGLYNSLNSESRALICHRNFGVGADGLILIEDHQEYDFQMIYYNSDGEDSSMCGNGGRCAVAFARDLGLVKNKETVFLAVDGVHSAILDQDNEIDLKMIDVKQVQKYSTHYFLDTGSPHHIEFHKDIDQIDVLNQGRTKRYAAPYFQEGANINFIEPSALDHIKIRTYERGVENETLACGTGATAAAIAHYLEHKTPKNIKLKALGGNLRVKFDTTDDKTFTNIWLKGPAEFVFKGQI